MPHFEIFLTVVLYQVLQHQICCRTFETTSQLTCPISILLKTEERKIVKANFAAFAKLLMLLVWSATSIWEDIIAILTRISLSNASENHTNGVKVSPAVPALYLNIAVMYILEHVQKSIRRLHNSSKSLWIHVILLSSGHIKYLVGLVLFFKEESLLRNISSFVLDLIF